MTDTKPTALENGSRIIVISMLGNFARVFGKHLDDVVGTVEYEWIINQFVIAMNHKNAELKEAKEMAEYIVFHFWNHPSGDKAREFLTKHSEKSNGPL